jgi:hypothetical protein
MNKEIEQKLAAWKSFNQPNISSLCMVFGLTLEEMAEAAEMWRGRKLVCNCKREDNMCLNSNDPTCQADKLWPERYKVGDQLKIKMPPDWDKDKPLLTRQEAEEIVKKHFPNSLTSRQSVDFYVALGMLKLKEEKPKDWRDEPIVKKAEEAENSAIEYGYSAVSADNVVRLHKLIENLLKIIKRGKP